MWGRQYEDDFHQFHDFEHLPGFLTVLLRALLWGIFVFGISRTLSSTPHIVMANLLKRLRIAGSIWFLAFPILVVATFLFPPYTRNQVITAASLTLQTAALAVMAKEFLTSSDYFRLSSLSHVGMAGPLSQSKSEKLKLAVD
jgi:hypothetical protein